MNEYIDTWGLYSYLPKNAEKYIHPLDIERLNKLFAHGKVFHCVAASESYLILQYRSETYRARQEPYRIVPTPLFNFGEQVRDKLHPEQIGIVVDIIWHSKNNKAMFFIEINGKLKSKRYFENDLDRVNHDG